MSALANRIDARNRVNKRAKELHAELTEFFAPFVGQKILKADFNLLSKIEAKLPKFEYNTTGLRIYQQRGEYRLTWHLSCYYEAGVGGKTENNDVEIGRVEDGFLKSLTPAPVERWDYTVAGVEAARANYQRAQRIADEAKRDLSPFGEFDH